MSSSRDVAQFEQNKGFLGCIQNKVLHSEELAGVLSALKG
tara:strand:+ start:2424 stop:2543 length:120 start_codon:yes stop_codon:yes gene_type:complete